MATSCTSASTSRRLAAGVALAALALLALPARADVVMLPAISGEVGMADLAGVRDRGAWRVGTVRTRFPRPMSFGVIEADESEDEYAFDCADGTYTYARRTLKLAGVVVRDVGIPEGRWAANRFPVPPSGSIPWLAGKRFCALKDVPAA
jgi:hypothetical protein